jgi:hypothetical protein
MGLTAVPEEKVFDEVFADLDEDGSGDISMDELKDFFRKIFENFFDNDIKIKDVKFRFKQFKDYVKVVSNYEIDLIDGGDSS